MQELIDFINESWDGTLRVHTEDEGTLVGLPKPYTVPSINDFFNELYYWDTYFTNIGLILSGKPDYAKNNTENIAYLIKRFGFMPNGNRTYYLNRTQPPFFSLMVKDVFSRTGDLAWLSEMYEVAKTEYDFWMRERSTLNGLNRYYHNLTGPDDPAIQSVLDEFCPRIGEPLPEDKDKRFELATVGRAMFESGWDCNSRFGLRLTDYNWLDLNCLLYGMENDMVLFAEKLDRSEEAALWRERAEKRRGLLNKYCWNERLGAFCDYDFVNQKTSDFLSLASFYPLFVSLATKEQAESTMKLLPKFECEFGLACCEDRDDLMHLQWDRPYGWACLHHIAITGMMKYAFLSDAKRIAEKYCALVEMNFKKNHNIWEKYNVVTGDVLQSKETKRKPITMMGWSAGVYLFANVIKKRL